MLVGVLKKLLPATEFDPYRADLAVLAALLHDLGHGPFSHTFESVLKARGSEKHHETWTAEIICDPKGQVRSILERFREGMSQQIADLITADEPRDVYHAVVSSSFDADRLDYLRRDRLMTGTGAGAIDFDWLLDNLRIAEIRRGGDDDVESESVRTFCLDEKALQSAESFLLARYHLFAQVYLHKTTRGMEAILRALLTKVAVCANEGTISELALDSTDPLVRFFQTAGDSIENYLALDDFAVWAAISRIANGTDQPAADLARRLQERRLYKALDIDTECPACPGESSERTEERRQREILRLETMLKTAIGDSVLVDEGEISIYGEIGADQARTHKMLSILLRDGSTHEITELSPLIRTLGKRRSVVRFYFPDDATRDKARLGRAE